MSCEGTDREDVSGKFQCREVPVRIWEGRTMEWVRVMTDVDSLRDGRRSSNSVLGS